MTSSDSPLERRTLLRGATAAGLGALLGGPSAAASLATSARSTSTAALPSASVLAGLAPKALAGAECTLTPQSTSGPFYFNPGLVRQDITEGKPGLPVVVFLQMLDANNGCVPIQNAVFDIWQCDALGAYSGYASEGTAGETFLRGIQFTDINGIASFQTIFPGTYPGRSTHIHFKARNSLTSQQELTGQLYFLDDYAVFINNKLAPYKSNPAATTVNPNDGIYVAQGGAQTTMFTSIVYTTPVFLVAGLQIRVNLS